MDIWDELYKKAAEKLNPRVLSPFIEAGGVALQFYWWGKGQMNANCNL